MRFSLLALLPLALFGCSSNAADTGCRVGADCVSGVCSLDGRCLPAEKTDSGSDVLADTGSAEETSMVDTGGDEVAGCAPNHDGTIEAKEVPLAAGLKATFRFAKNASFATAGIAKADGTKKWDLSVAFPGDTDTVVRTEATAGTWYGSKFPTATYATPLSGTSDLLGVFKVDPAAILLQGVASPADGLSKTELTYAPAIPTISFPLKVGSAWKTTSNVTGTAMGVAVFYTETYDDKVDAKGEMVTPFGSFDVLRVKVVLTRTVGAAITVTRTYAFVTECFGTVASVTSNANELSDEFTTAAELRRIAP
ncbi:MAG: hypothetical protein ACXVEF_30405 [Polyangiales bacterium]